MKNSVFYLANLCCSTEEALIRSRLERMPGISDLKFNVMEHRVVVIHSLPDDQPILAALEQLGMGPRGEDASQPESRQGSRWETLALVCAGVLASASEVLAYLGWHESSPYLVAMAAGSMLLSGRDTLRKGALAMRSLTLNINFLMSVAVIGAMAIGQWPEAAMVCFLFALAEKIEGHALDSARNAIRALMELSPDSATLVDASGRETRVDADQITPGQRLRVKPGERVPLDGQVVSGSSSINQAPITGESVPVEKRPGDPVFAGTVNERGSFDFTVTAARGQTTLDRIVASVQQAQSERAPTQRTVDQIARYYTPAMLLLALGLATIPPLALGAPALPWVYRGLTLLVVACPCALVISTPVTVVSGLAAAARNGFLIKGGVYLENGRRLRAIALDKTGTLTEGKPEVTDLITLSALTTEEVLSLTASLEAHSEHPLAAAILARSKARESPPEVADFEALVGRGIRGRVDGKLYSVGSYRMVGEAGLETDELKAHWEKLEQAGKSVLFLLDDSAVLGLIAVADRVRASSVAAVGRLRQLGVETVLLSGDHQKTAEVIAAEVGIEQARGNLLPEDKLREIESLLQRYGYVGMVGDGINDAPALARASVGFAMGAAGTASALETADVALMQDDLGRLPQFIELSRQTGRILLQNIVFSLTVKFVAVALTFTGHLTLWLAIFADMGASLLVIANGLRLLRFGRGAPPA
jgi:Cd2+/Zn2+-exporting ATPase